MNKIVEKYRLLSAPAKATLWFTICNLLVKGISFISVPIFTRMMSDEEYGILSIFMSYEQVILIIATWEIQLGAYQKGLFNFREDQKLFTSATQALVNILTVVVFTIIFLLNGIITNITGMSVGVLAVLFVYLLLQPSYSCWLARKRTEYDYKPAVIVTLVYSVANVLVPMVTLYTIGKTANVKFIFTLIASCAVCIFFYIPFANYSALIKCWNKVKRFWKFLIKFEAPLVLHSLSYLILSQADRVMIGCMVGNAQAAYYSVAYSLSSIVIIFQNSINQALLPWRYQMLQNKNYKKLREVTSVLLVAMATIVLCVILVVPEIMKLFFASNYYEALWSIPPITVGVFFMFLYTIFVNIESYYEKTQYVMYVSVTCGVFNILLNYVCIKLFGYIACGYTTMISYILFALGHYFFMSKILNSEDVKDQVVDGKMVLFISIAVISIAIGITCIYDHILIRYGIVFALMILGILKRNRIKDFMSQFRDK